VNLSDPTRAVTPTLDGPVLAALAVAGKPLTVGQLAEQTARGSEIGVRRSLARLVEQGIVSATLMGRNQVHELNRDHVAADIAISLAGLRSTLWENFRREFKEWKVRPLYASVFGSAARADGDEASDIDLCLVHPPFPGERKSPRMTASIKSQVADAVAEFVASSEAPDSSSQWEIQVDQLRDRVVRWTGNSLQVVDLSLYEWRHPPRPYRQLMIEIEHEGVELVKRQALSIWRPTEPTDA
jgi:predicted nucleotidyltransferase